MMYYLLFIVFIFYNSLTLLYTSQTTVDYIRASQSIRVVDFDR
jgi:hypothetical protein